MASVTTIILSGFLSAASLSGPMNKVYFAVPGEKIEIELDSAGGDVNAITRFTTAMAEASARQVSVSCTVKNNALAAAFLIFVTCDKRTVSPKAKFSLGPVFIKSDWDGQRALRRQVIATQLIMKEFGLSEKVALDRFFEERITTGKELKKLAPHAVTLINH